MLNRVRDDILKVHPSLAADTARVLKEDGCTCCPVLAFVERAIATVFQRFDYFIALGDDMAS